MPKPTRTPREQLERAMHVSFKLPEQARAMLDAHEQQALAAARARVEQLPTANQGQLICATREQILDAITRTGQEG